MYSKQRGQIMLMTSLVLSGTVLAAITIAGLLMLYQIRQAGNAEQSAQAVFAANAGLEYELYKFYTADCGYPAPQLRNGAEVFSRTNVVGSDVVFSSNALSGKTIRAFNLRFVGLASEERCVSAAVTTP